MPDSIYPMLSGHFGVYGGRFVAETLIEPLEELTRAYRKYIGDKEFLAEFERDLTTFVGRPSPLYHARRWGGQFTGARVYLKREDLNHTGAHKVNNTVGQALLAKRMGKDPHHRGDGSRPARCGHGYRCRPHGPGVRRLHGRRGTYGARR